MKRSMSLRTSGSSNMSTTNGASWKMLSGNKKLKERYNASSKRIRLLTMLG